MSLDLPHLIETAADEVANAGRAAAGSINDLVHDWSAETRSFVSDHASVLPGISSRKRSRGTSMVRLLLPIAVLSVVALVLLRRRRPTMTPHLPDRQPQDHIHETVVGSPADSNGTKESKESKAKAAGAAAS